MGTPVLECRDLTVQFKTNDGIVAAVSHLNLAIKRGECFGIVGESGSGKTQTSLAIMGLLAENGIASGSVKLNGREILNQSRAVLDSIRGNEMTMIFQDAMSSLTPFMRIGEQMCEGLIRHKGYSESQARARVLEALEMVRIPAAARRYKQYPHEMSGGMCQRVMIAQALLCKPSVLIADEPTTALDVTVQAEILEILAGLKRHTDTSIILITHDLGVVAGICDQVAVMYGGRIIEHGLIEDIFYKSHHPYTAGLLASIPTIKMDPSEDLAAIPGQPPNLLNLPAGCHFSPRCRRRFERCDKSLPELRRIAPDHTSACFLGT
ncbi:MAG: ABC transporter ATP-binding protein [Gammaproteobacteria bacterium]|nr:ABC transporter ATP-binding protein [Gammaproteobacteria bacterium]